MKSIATLLIFTGAFAMLPVEAGQDSDRPSVRPLVYVPVLPYEFLVERLAGNWVEVHSIIKEGDDCHSYSPAPKQIAEMTRANLLFTGKLGFEANFFVAAGDGKSGPLIVNLLDGLDLLEGTCEECAADVEGHKHSHEDLKDPHVWLSPRMLRKLAPRMASILKEFVPDEGDAEIDANLDRFQEELETLEGEMRESLAPLKGKRFYVYHGAFAYFARDFELEQFAIELQNRQPTPNRIAELARTARQDTVKLVFVQPQFDQTVSRVLASSIDGRVVELDPLQKDVFLGLRKIVSTVRLLQED